MINIENFIAALKITWIRQLFSPTMTPTNTLFETLISPINKIHTLGSQYIYNQNSIILKINSGLTHYNHGSNCVFN